jgi:hypothetical protein
VSTSPLEPVVRLRCTVEQEPRARQALAARGFEAERSLTFLVVRQADPDAVNEALVAGGAAPRTVVRERIGALLGWLLDHGGAAAGHEAALERLVRRVLDDGGLSARYAPREPAALMAAAATEHERLMASGAARLSWEEFLRSFARVR